jgi:hypothetical protein
MEEILQLHIPTALSPGKEFSVPIAYEAWWAIEPVWTLWKTDICLPLPGIESRFPGCSARSRGTILAELVGE